MKTLLVLRHGKSSWTEPVADHERPLSKRGKRASVRIGQEIQARDVMPDLVVTSTATRAGDTARRVAEAAGYGGATVATRDLYLTGTSGHLETLAGVDDAHQRVMVVGHNPDLEDLVSRLTGEPVHLTTANLACIDLGIDSWSDVASARGDLRFLLRARELE